MGNGLAPYGGADVRNLPTNNQPNSGTKQRRVQKVNTTALTSNKKNVWHDQEFSSNLSQSQIDQSGFDQSFNLAQNNQRSMHATHYGTSFKQHMIDLSSGGQIVSGSTLSNSGGAFIQMQGTPDHGLSKYGSSIVHKNDNLEKAENDVTVGPNMKDYSNVPMVGVPSNNQVKLPEIGYGVSHSTEVPDGFQKLNGGINNFYSDPYALRIKQPQNTAQKPGT